MGAVRGLHHDAAAVPVRLDLGAPPAVQPDLQHIGSPAPGRAEPDLQPGTWHGRETGYASRLFSRGVQDGRCSPAAHARKSGPYPQPPAAGTDEAGRRGAHFQPHAYSQRPQTDPPGNSCQLSAPRRNVCSMTMAAKSAPTYGVMLVKSGHEFTSSTTGPAADRRRSIPACPRPTTFAAVTARSRSASVSSVGCWLP